MPLTGRSFIGNSRGTGNHSCGSGINPSTGEKLLPDTILTTEKEQQVALKLAAASFPVYQKKSGLQKAHFLLKIAELLGSKTDLLLQHTPLETALKEERIRGEIGRTCFQLQLYANMLMEGSWVDARIEHAQPDRLPLPKPDLRSINQPLGPVAVFAASNFPLAYSVAGGDTASALAAGCPVIVKAHSSHPATSEIVATCIVEAAQLTGMPEGVFSMLFGPGSSVGKTLVQAPQIKAVGFTGSQTGGRALMDLAAARPCPIPVYAEMSAINPIVILPSALGESSRSLADSAFHSISQGVGQFCTNPGLFFLPKDHADDFLNQLQLHVNQANSGTMLNAAIHTAYLDQTSHLEQQLGIEKLAQAEGNDFGCAAPVIFQTCVSLFIKNPQLKEEVFGPSSLIVTYQSSEDLIAAIASLEGQLTSSIHGSEEEFSKHTALIQRLENTAGRIIFNGFPTGVEVCSSIVHGGPYPATSDGRSSSVGSLAILRFTRSVCYQNSPQALLPDELKDSNPLQINRMVDGKQICL